MFLAFALHLGLAGFVVPLLNLGKHGHSLFRAFIFQSDHKLTPVLRVELQDRHELYQPQSPCGQQVLQTAQDC